jgi:SSS family solute:Na+ symporter
MVATTFASDTPNWVAEQVRRFGVAGNWQWWAFALTGVATVFFFARLWRRSGVLTDLEFYELRYSGSEASWVRGFRAIYLGLFYNCFIMAMVTLAASKIANILFGIRPIETILITGVLNVAFAAHSGLWGVLVIDMIQFFIKMAAVIAAAWFSLVEVGRRLTGRPEVFSGLQALMGELSKRQAGEGGQPVLDLFPSLSLSGGLSELALMTFIVPIAVSWWANWYPGSEPGGGSYIAQRMLASKSEKDSLGGTLFFNFAHYVLRPWPWILTALCSIIVYPDLESIRVAFPEADPNLIGHDSAFPAMLKFLPTGFVGLMIGGLIAANSSTILTHLNWGSSYLVHDYYRRFLRKGETEKHYVGIGRLLTVLLYAIAALLSLTLTTAQEAFQILLSIGAGTGLIYVVRWFWWRVSAWSEITAMAVSLLTSWLVPKLMPGSGFAGVTLVQVFVTTISWILVARFGPETDRETLISFYRKVRPSGPGWETIRIAAGEPKPRQMGTVPLVAWGSGCLFLWSTLFTLGNFLYLAGDPSREVAAWTSLTVCIASGLTLIVTFRKTIEKEF